MSYKFGVTWREFLTILLVIFNAFTWYLMAMAVLIYTLGTISITPHENTLVWVIHFVVAVCAALVGATLSNRLINRNKFLSLWMLLGVVSSSTPIIVGTTLTSAAVFSLLLGVAFGLGMPSCLAFYADSTVIEKRGRLGGVIFFAVCVGLSLFGAMVVPGFGVVKQTVILTVWRGFGLTAFLALQPKDRYQKVKKTPSYAAILRRKPFCLYFIPWIMFCLVNFLSAPMFPADIRVLTSLVGFFVTGIFALIGGLLSDWTGRKRVATIGFVTLGVGYAILGIFPGKLISYYLFTVVDGVAWGMFGPVFLMTLWGDLAEDMSPEKYYAIGGLPYLLSGFLELLVAPYIRELVPTSAVFSFASFFLFLAVVPLIYAPETLPEREIRRRELRRYIEKAKKLREDFTKPLKN